jgi:hypothetical protein
MFISLQMVCGVIYISELVMLNKPFWQLFRMLNINFGIVQLLTPQGNLLKLFDANYFEISDPEHPTDYSQRGVVMCWILWSTRISCSHMSLLSLISRILITRGTQTPEMFRW